MSNDNPSWPTAGERLFRSDLPDWKFNARLHQSHQWLAYAMAYHYVAETIFDDLKRRGGGGVDFLVYPLAFCYRQYIELQLKSLIQAGSDLIDEDPKFAYSHNLDQLWTRCRTVLENIDPPPFETDLDAVEEKIKQFDVVDPTGMSFRYPVGRGRAGEPVLLPLDLNTFNVRHFVDQIEQIASFLDAAGEQISAFLDIKQEMQFEAGDSASMR